MHAERRVRGSRQTCLLTCLPKLFRHPLPEKLFIVVDPKQAIYRFRRADVGTYEEVKQLLLRRH